MRLIVGQKYKDFEIIRVTDIQELQCQLCELVHQPTQAQVMAIINDDPENVFCLSFQTIPESSNGVAHILEHTVLCGSKKFPVKDPFFAMNRRSLNTFMNAFTGADFTCYPASSQVPQDFYNLLDVYIDAVFNPILDELSFLQEGHRLEFEIPWDSTTPLQFKGIVYNEMKGALASSSARLTEAMNESLFPSITYGYNSGGDPKIIPQLSYAELKEFHKTFYHPSRCLFFFYGNMPLEKHLDYIAENALKGIEAVPSLPPLALQPRFKEPVYRELRYPVSSQEKLTNKGVIGFGWLTAHILNQQEVLALTILEIVLLDTDASPLKMALLKSKLCQQVSAYIDDDLSELPLTIFLKGCQVDGADELENVIKTTLQEIVKKGIPKELVENAIHQLEFHKSEITGDHTPFGLSLFMRSGLIKQHGVNPEEGLKIHSLFKSLREHIENHPLYLEELIQKYLLDNTHFVRIVMVPDPLLGDEENREERALLDKIHENLSQDKIKEIIHQGAELLAFQKKQEEEGPDILPKVTLDDVPHKSRYYFLNKDSQGPLSIFSYHTFTNDIIYSDLIYDLPKIAEADLSYVRLFSNLMFQMGCDGRDYRTNLDYIQAHTGGVSAFISLNTQVSDHRVFYPTLHLRGKALNRKADKLFSLLKETATSVDFTDLSRLKEIILKHHTSLESSLNQNSLRYAINLSASGLNVASKIMNDWYGLNYYWKIRDIARNFDVEGPKLLAKLLELKDQMLCLANPHLLVTCQEEVYNESKAHGFYGLDQLPTKTFNPWKANYPLPIIESQARLISSPIAFIGKVFDTVSYVHPQSAALSIVSFLFDNITLHKRIREQGGAYGSGAASHAMSGHFYYYSYRDPNITSTLQAFQESITTILNGDFDEVDIEEAQLEMVQSLDSPVSPGSQGELAYSWLREGKTPEIRQQFRDRLLALTKDEVIQAVKDQIVPYYSKGATVVFAEKSLIEKENQTLKTFEMPPLEIFSV